jgi:hypothetical protein
MMSQGRDRCLANFKVLTYRAVSGDIGLCFVAYGFVDSALSRDRRLPRGFRSTASFFQGPTMSGLEPAHFCGQFASAELMPGALLKFCDVGRLFFRHAATFGSHLAPGHADAAMPAGARRFPPRCSAASTGNATAPGGSSASPVSRACVSFECN